MKPSVLVCLLFLALAACVKSTLPYNEQFTYKGLNATTQDLKVTTQDSVHLDDKFYVSMEIVIHARQMSKYPVTYAGLQKALDTWISNLPLRLSIYIEDPDLVQMPFPFATPSMVNRWNVVEILMDDIQAPPYSASIGVLGLWDSHEKQLMLDADYLEVNPDQAYSVALHELGHMFGLPHLVGEDDPAISGWLVVPKESDAQSYVMYPRQMPGKSQSVLSKLEIEMARHNLLHLWTTIGSFQLNENCELTDQPQ